MMRRDGTFGELEAKGSAERRRVERLVSTISAEVVSALIPCSPRHHLPCRRTGRRLDNIEMRARSITLKIMIRDPNAPVGTAKFMGLGLCAVMNKQAALHSSNGRAMSDPLVIGQQAWSMLKASNFDPHELRGVGIQLQKLKKLGLRPQVGVKSRR